MNTKQETLSAAFFEDAPCEITYRDGRAGGLSGRSESRSWNVITSWLGVSYAVASTGAST